MVPTANIRVLTDKFEIKIMKFLIPLYLSLILGSCAYKNIGEYGPNTSIVAYNELPSEVKSAYGVEFKALTQRSLHAPVVIINLDSAKVTFSYHKSTSVAIIKPGKEVYKIGSKRFYLPWNLNRELNPHVLFDKKLYAVYTVTTKERLTYYKVENLETNRYLKVDLSKHLNYKQSRI